MMKSILTKKALLLCLAAIPLLLPAQEVWDGTTVDTEWEGLGTAESPYLIGSAAELAGLAQRTNADETFEGKYFLLTADVSLSDPAAADEDKPLWTPIGLYTLNNDDPEDNPGGIYSGEHWFKGHFDGGGHTIRNLWYTGSTDFDEWNDPFGSGQLDFTAWFKAFFGLLDGATVCNLRLEDANVAGTALIGGLAIRAKNSTFTDIHVSGHIKSGDYSAGGSAAALVVEAENSRFLRCSSSADVFGKSRTGGLIGALTGASTVEHCSSEAHVTGSVNIGGLIGVSSAIEGDESGAVPTVRLSTSAATVTIIPGRNQGDNGAGFIGMNAGRISQCGATGKVNVQSDCGAGFCDDNYGHIESCYSTADVTSDDYGVFLSAFVTDNGVDVGYDSKKGTILNCYGAGNVYAPAPPDDVITTGTHINGFAAGIHLSAGSYLAGNYYDCTKVPEVELPGIPGIYGQSTEYLQSREFVDSLNFMAALMGTYLWQYNAGGYPTPTDVPATEVKPFFDGGKGTEAEPFLIATKQQLQNLAYAANRNWEFRGQYLRQTAGIALNAPMEAWGEQMPEAWTPIARYGDNTMNDYSHHFSGTYDGAMHTVQNLYMDKDVNTDVRKYYGLFGVLGTNACIKNLGVTDAWVNGEECVGILAGANCLQNDHAVTAPATISHCWTSGQVTGGSANGGILGKHNPGSGYDEPFTMVACYSTATAKQGLIGNNYVSDYEVIGSWYGGSIERSYGNAFAFSNADHYFFTYQDVDKNPVSEQDINNGYPHCRTTAYMQSRQFVNDMNYAAAARGHRGGWGWNEGDYPSFAGEQPTIGVTLNDGVNEPISFLALEGSVISLPEAPEREGLMLEGWYTDTEYTQAFGFGLTPVTAPVTLHARWIAPIEADYSVFKNKFSNTYTLTTAAQLCALANIINEQTDEIEWTDFAGKTIKLGADIELNDISGFDLWGTSITPRSFTAIAYNQSHPFQGTFDGQGHSITGLYQSYPKYNEKAYGLFGYLGQEAVVKDLILDKAYIAKTTNSYAGLLAAEAQGTISRVGVEGKIAGQATYQYPMGNGGIAGHTTATSNVSECYALVDMEMGSDACGGLIGERGGTLTDCYARGSVTYQSNGAFGGVSVNGGSGMNRCYAAVTVSFGETPRYDINTKGNVGGAYGTTPYGSTDNPGFYNRDLVQSAFDALSEEYQEQAYNRGTALTTEQMNTMAAFTGFDFTTVWGRRNDLNNGYPYLRWTAEAGLDNDVDTPVGIDRITLDGADRVSVYTLQGTTVYTGRYANARLTPGIYLVRRGNVTAKVVIR